MTYCDTCGHQYSDICGGCEGLDGVPVKYTPKTSETIYCKDCKFRTESNLPYPSFYCTHFNCHCELLGCDEGERKTKTNADRIRNMTDEELADEILGWFNWLNAVEWDDKRIIEWLKQEVKE